MKEKKLFGPNECSFLRWIVTALVGSGAGMLLCAPFISYMDNRVDTFMGITCADFFAVLFFIPLFVCTVLAIKFVAKTSLKDFVLGVGGKIDKKTSLLVFGLFVLGMGLVCLVSLNNIRVRAVNPGQYAFLVVFMLLLVWLQTTFEELVFRGLLLRWVCKNNIGYSKKAWIVGVITAVAFALCHAPNPEVTSQSGWNIVFALLAYAVPGIIFFWANMHFKSLLPGIIMHWFNNFFLMTIFGSESAVVGTPTLLIDGTPQSGVWSFVSNILLHLPIMVYMIVDIIVKKKKSASVNAK